MYVVQVSCQEDNFEHNGYLVYASVMTCIFPIGIPLLYLVLLVRDRGELHPDPENKKSEIRIVELRELNKEIQYTIFLWGSYRPKVSWWDSDQRGRRRAERRCEQTVGNMICPLVVHVASRCFTLLHYNPLCSHMHAIGVVVRDL